MSTVRIVLILSLLVLAYCAALLIYAVPWLCLIVAIAAALAYGRRTYVRLTDHGTATWGNTRSELKRAGIIGVADGIVIGNAISEPPGAVEATRALFDRRVTAWDASFDFVMSLRKFNKLRREHPTARLSRSVHTAIFSRTGGGKSVGVVIPTLLRLKDSMVVVDPKGELYRLTSDARRAMGHQIVVIDLFGLVTKTPDTFEPVSLMDPESDYVIDEARTLATELAPTPPDDKNPFFTDSARAMISAMIILVVYHGFAGRKTIQTVRSIIADPVTLQQGIEKLCASQQCGGMVARIGSQLQFLKDRELSNVLATVQRFLNFLDTPAVHASTSGNSFDPTMLTKGLMTIYLVMPPEHLADKAALVRMWIGSLMRTVIRAGLQEKKKVYFIVDEAAQLGQMDAIDKALTVLRGYGVRLLLVYQSHGQLLRCFPAGQDKVMLGNVTEVYFATNDKETTEYISAKLGEATIVTQSGGESDGSSQSFDKDGHGSRGTSRGGNRNWALTGRPLLRPEEVSGLDPTIAITFTPGIAPIWTKLVPSYADTKPSRFKSFCQKLEITTAAVLLLALSIGLAAVLTAAATKHPHGSPHGAAVPQGNWR